VNKWAMVNAVAGRLRCTVVGDMRFRDVAGGVALGINSLSKTGAALGGRRNGARRIQCNMRRVFQVDVDDRVQGKTIATLADWSGASHMRVSSNS
jgi:hypothetical protein